MAANANISSIILTNTFDEWRTRTNDLIEDRNILRNAPYVKDNSNFTLANGVLRISKNGDSPGTTLVNDNDAYIGNDLVVAFDATVGRNTLSGNLTATMNTVSGNVFVTTLTNTSTINVRTQANIFSENVITSNIMTLNVEASGAKANIATLNVTSQENSVKSNIVTANITTLNVNGSWFHTANIANSNTANSWTGNAVGQYLTITNRANVEEANIKTANIATLNVNATGAYANILTLNVNATGARANVLEANITTSNIATLNVNAPGATAIIETLNVTSQANATKANLVTANIATLNVYAAGASANIRTANILSLNVESTGAYANIATLNVTSQANSVKSNILVANIATLNVEAAGARANIATLNVTSQANSVKSNILTANIATLNVNAVGSSANILAANISTLNVNSTGATAIIETLNVSSQANAAKANLVTANIATLNVNAVGSSANIATANITTLNVATTGGIANIANVTIANSITTNAIVTTANVTTLAVNGATATANIRVANVATLNVNAPGATAIMETLNVTSQANAVKANLETANIATLNVNAVGSGANIRIANVTTLNVNSTGAAAFIETLNVSSQANAVKANLVTANIATLNVNASGASANIATANITTLNVNTTGATANIINASITTANITTGNISGTLNIVTTGSKAIINELILSNSVTGYKILNGDGSFKDVEVNGNFVKKGTEINTLDTSQLRATVDMDNDGYYKVFRGNNNGPFKGQNASIKFSSTYNVWQAAANDNVLLPPGTQFGYNTILTTQNLDSTVTSTSTVQAATPQAVKTTYDLASLAANSVMLSANSAGTLTRKHLNFVNSPTTNVSVAVHGSDSANANVTLTVNTSALYTGTTNYVTKFASEHTIGNSLIYDNGTNVGLGTTSPTYKLHVAGTSYIDALTAGSVVLPQNPVGAVYSGVSGQPTYYIGQTNGDNDYWKIYGESPNGTNTGSLILQSEDDFDINESIRLRFKKTYSPYNTNDILVAQYNNVAINGLLSTTGSLGVKTSSPSYDLHVAGTGYASSDFRAPIFYDSADVTYYLDPASTSRLSGLQVVNTISGYISGARFSNDSETKDDITTRTESGFYQTSTATTGEGWPLTLPAGVAWMHLLSTTHNNDTNYYAMQLSASFYEQGLYYRSTANSGTTLWNRMAMYNNWYSGNLLASGFYMNSTQTVYMDSPGTNVLALYTASTARLRIELDGTINAGFAVGPSNYTIGAYAGTDRHGFYSRVTSDSFKTYIGTNSSGVTTFYVDGNGSSYFGNSVSINGNTGLAIKAQLTSGADANFHLFAVNGSSTNSSGEEVARFGIGYGTNVTTNFSSGFSFIRGGGAADGSLAILTNATERVRINSAGNVGIGTSTPSYSLDVNGTARVASLIISGGVVNGIPYLDSNKILTTSALTFNGTSLGVSGIVTAGALVPSSATVPTNGMYLPSTNIIGFATNGVQRFIINGSGTATLTGDLSVSGALSVGSLSVSSLSLPGSLNVPTLNATTVAASGVVSASTVSTATLNVTGATNFYGPIGFSDLVNVTNTTASSSTTTGAVKIAGGLGVVGAINSGSISSASASFTNLSVTNSIGGYVNGARFNNGSENADNITSRITSGFYQIEVGTTAKGWPLNSNWQHLISSTHSNGGNYYALQLAASFYEQGLFYRSTNGNGSTAWNRLVMYNNQYSGAIYANRFGLSTGGSAGIGGPGIYSGTSDQLSFSNGTNEFMRIDSTSVRILSTATAGNYSSGALVVSGGAGIAGRLYVGGVGGVSAQFDSLVIFNGLVQVVGASTFTGVVTLGSTTSNGSGSGALVVPGGVGIGGNLNIGSSLNVSGQIQSGQITSSGTVGGTALYTSNDVTGARFVDVNNTNYYINPAEYSYVSSIVADNWLRTTGDTGWYNNTHGVGIRAREISTFFGLINSKRIETYGNVGSFKTANLVADNSVQAPIYYDSDDTSYYLDLTGVNSLGAVKVDSIRMNNVQWAQVNGHNSYMIMAKNKLFTGTSLGNHRRGITGRFYTDEVAEVSLENLKEVVFPETTAKLIKVGNQGSGVAFALFDNGNLYTWGYNVHGQCGLGHTNAVAVPTLSNTNVTEVYTHPSGNNYHVDYGRLFIKKTDGYIYGCGSNQEGALGIGTTSHTKDWTKITSMGTNVSYVWNMAGWAGCTFFQKSDGKLFAAGWNYYGQLGTGTTTRNYPTPTDVTTNWLGTSGATVTKITGGYGHAWDGGEASTGMTMMLRSDGIVRVCGDNGHYALGTNNTTNYSSPTTPIGLTGVVVSDIACTGSGSPSTCGALLADGRYYTWGFNDQGQCGITGAGTRVGTPTLAATGVTELLWDQVSAKHNYAWYATTYIKKADGYYSAGYGYYGQCATGRTRLNIDKTDTYIKMLIPRDFQIEYLAKILVHGYHGDVCYAISTDGRMLGWGYQVYECVVNSYGGDNSISHPVNILLPIST